MTSESDQTASLDPLASSDQTVIDLLRRDQSMTISELASHLGVTATAVRQRLARMGSEGLVERTLEKRRRGRPNHRYSLTEKGLRESGTNFGDLSIALWREVRAVKDPEVRRGLLQRIASFLSHRYRRQVEGETLTQRMESLKGLMAERSIPLRVNEEGELPVLSALACPYPGLPEIDRSICSMENMMFSEVLGTRLKLSECRLDGDHCCTFEVKSQDGMLVDSP